MAKEISLVTYNGSLVTPKHDASIHDIAVGNGILYGCQITIKDATTLHMTAGMGIVYGRQFELFESDITVPLAEVTSLGRLYLHMDLGNIDEPVQLLAETGVSLSELVDNPNINIENSSTDMELATFEVTTKTIDGLKITYSTVERNEKRFRDAESSIKELNTEISTLNVNLGKKMDAIQRFSPKGIWCGTFVKTNYTGGTSVLLQNTAGTTLTRSTLNNWFGVNYSEGVAKAHYVAFVMNADAATTGIHITGTAWNNDAIYAVAEQSLSGKTFRINWCVMLF